MGTKARKEREREQRRKHILTCAKELFMIKGLSHTTMEDIAKRTELSQGTLYLYFKNKEDLYASLNLITLQLLYDETEKVFINNMLGPDAKILKLKDVFYSLYIYDPLILQNIIRLQVEDDLMFLSSKVLSRINMLTKRTMTLISRIYEEGVRQGVFNEEKGIVIADSMWALFTGVVLYEGVKRKFNPKKDFLESTLDVAFDIFCRGLKKINGDMA